MRSARGMVLALAVLAAAGAAVTMRTATPERGAPARTADTVDILVAARPIAAGEIVGATDVRWQAWPKSALIEGSIIRTPSNETGARTALAPARYPILAGEPILDAKLVRPGSGGVMAALVSPGMRAISVPIREETAAGGFIQPQDRVDVLLTRKGREAHGGKGASDILLKGAKILAIGKALDGKGGSAGQIRTATLELTPGQARQIAGAQAAGDISLALVASADASGEATVADMGSEFEQPVRIMKFGRRADKGTN